VLEGRVIGKRLVWLDIRDQKKIGIICEAGVSQIISGFIDQVKM